MVSAPLQSLIAAIGVGCAHLILLRDLGQTLLDGSLGEQRNTGTKLTDVDDGPFCWLRSGDCTCRHQRSGAAFAAEALKLVETH